MNTPSIHISPGRRFRVPEPAVDVARVVVESMADRVRRPAVPLLAGVLVERHDHVAGHNIVERIECDADEVAMLVNKRIESRA